MQVYNYIVSKEFALYPYIKNIKTFADAWVNDELQSDTQKTLGEAHLQRH